MKAITDSGYKLITTPVRKYYKYNDSAFTPPIMTWNGLLGFSEFAVDTSSYRSTYLGWRMFDGDTSSPWEGDNNSAQGSEVIVYNPNPINIPQWQYTLGNTHYGTLTEEGSISGSNDGVNYTQIGTYTLAADTSTLVKTINLTYSDYYKYHKWNITNSSSGGTVSGSWRHIMVVSEVTFPNATERTVVSGTESDYDFYEDVVEYNVLD